LKYIADIDIAMIGAAIAWIISVLLREVVLMPTPITAPHSDHMMNPCNKMTNDLAIFDFTIAISL